MILIVQIGADWYAIESNGAPFLSGFYATVVSGPHASLYELTVALQDRERAEKLIDG